jgi:hypothetical protein
MRFSNHPTLYTIRFGLGWGIGGEKRYGEREARAGEAQVNEWGH